MQSLFHDEKYLEYLETFITKNRKEGFKKVLANRTKHFTVVCEDVYQLHNTSAVMRSCEVFGIQELNVVEQRFGKKIDKEIALGAEKWVDIKRFSNNQDCINNLRTRGYQIIATTPHEKDSMLEDFDISKPSAIYFGTERLGISDEVIKNADGFLKIPMVGFTESLNISVSAAIIIQSLTNRLRHSNVNWGLTDLEFLEKRIDWTRKSIKDIDFITERYFEQIKVK
ncbi:TrmH family RNA methyltransferase [Flavobacterium columnare NBRC 100251 = ATCC 23463]|uniref:tRNA (guanosine(18)-2'-O)-methyltransferase n=1 Tax=Flavobacterium columnare (strain ATCC 49512 / CIP 103533 / TG 44/87) TaxID=1041826 RepID=G8XB35_FLACA|nr:RNA methyltransferase [Flavobacterium columnare]AEW86003.1 putative tRNA/rRNA methyltransferase [Flavobacterium columnare ATCC 49512]ANO48769.1 putative tRNA/rRNA methyltransferase [Flavobacterium columnare]APT23201.1 rRNA methyltransferase [Flavobacterium columnare]MBF6653007.1 TrmH family RNA methyltransferase [Flavobacterium columnare]MBF6654169.1 TrmH family RNA methyltransferase [Flavobacterium columnare]